MSTLLRQQKQKRDELLITIAVCGGIRESASTHEKPSRDELTSTKSFSETPLGWCRHGLRDFHTPLGHGSDLKLQARRRISPRPHRRSRPKERTLFSALASR